MDVLPDYQPRVQWLASGYSHPLLAPGLFLDCPPIAAEKMAFTMRESWKGFRGLVVGKGSGGLLVLYYDSEQVWGKVLGQGWYGDVGPPLRRGQIQGRHCLSSVDKESRWVRVLVL